MRHEFGKTGILLFSLFTVDIIDRNKIVQNETMKHGTIKELRELRRIIFNINSLQEYVAPFFTLSKRPHAIA